MARGKYSPYIKDADGYHFEWKTGKLGYAVEVNKDGFDYYGYNVDGHDRAGKTEDDYLLMDDAEFDSHCIAASAGTVHVSAHDQLIKLQDALKRIDTKAEAGLCQMDHAGTRGFLKDIRKIAAEFEQ